MKALDSSVLLSLLNGDSAARDLVKRLRDVELATTEADLLELAFVATRTRAHARRRRDVLDRLRQKITVLPIDSRGVSRASQHLERGLHEISPLRLSMLGSLESAGCDELFTRENPSSWGKWRFKITRFGHGHR